jgi:orotate phosphoribosyltransferase
VTPQAESILELFRSTGAYLNGHFRLTSGLHSPGYLQCALVLQYPRHAAELGILLSDELRNLVKTPIGLVVSPALGGLIIGHEVARAMGARFIFTERDENKKMTLRRGFAVVPGEPALVVEDVVTTGGSTRDVVEVLRAAGARPVAAGSIVDRSGGLADVGVPRAALVTLTVPAYEAAECPLCAQGMPAVKPGSRPA